MMPANSTGPKMAETQNHFVRTRSTNSRRMTAQTLRMGPSIPACRDCRRGVGADEVDENLVERRTRQLEPREARTGGHERAQDLLGIGARSELQLGLLAKVLDFRHQPPIREDLLRAALAAVERDDYVLPAVRALHLGERSVDELLPSRDDAQPVAQLFRMLHDMCRKQDGLAATPVFQDGVTQHLRVHRVESGERLVENHEIGIMQDG